MEPTRVRVESILEWAVAAVLIVATLAAGFSIVHQFRTVDAVTPVIAREAAPASPAPVSVPPRAVFVPMLLLPDGNAVHIGDSLSQIATRLGRQAEVGLQALERAPHGERLTRYYEHAGSQFILVFEPFQQDAEPQVAGIYLQ